MPSEGESASRRVGKPTLDLGLSVAIVDQKRCQEIAACPRERGFAQVVNARGNHVRMAQVADVANSGSPVRNTVAKCAA